MKISVLESQPFAENTYIVHWPDQSECFVVDPGFESGRILRQLQLSRLRVVAILNTHGHLDHIAGNAELKAKFPTAPLLIGQGDAPMLTDPVKNHSITYGQQVISPPADQLLRDGEEIRLLGCQWLVREIPGHSPGHVVFICQDVEPLLVFAGDVLFKGSVGRSDFPEGDGALLIAGIKEKLYSLPDDTLVLPGHGPSTTIGDEKRTNPFTMGTAV